MCLAVHTGVGGLGHDRGRHEQPASFTSDTETVSLFRGADQGKATDSARFPAERMHCSREGFILFLSSFFATELE